MLDPGLYLVSTPIGNLEDITLRALRVLRQAACVFAEDTRHTLKLLNYYGIRTRMLSCHAHNEAERSRALVERVRRGEAVALVCSAGTPGVSDPGARLVAAALDAGTRVIPIPGACAVITSLVPSGLRTDDFLFLGFLPSKPGARKRRLQSVCNVEATLIFYVPPTDLLPVLRHCGEVLGPARKCCVARELTKVHEEFYRGTLEAAAEAFEGGNAVGEVTLLIEGSLEPSDGPEGSRVECLESALKERLLGGESPSQAAKTVARELGVGRKRVYETVLRLAGDEKSDKQC